MSTTKKRYAPVLIPTLNRYNHFKDCLESLEKCKYAEFTPVYVSLDFPPSDKYREGWCKISAYLYEKEKSNGFLKLIVFRQTENLGLSYPSNYTFLQESVLKEYNCYISTEDDNVFSYRFLEYMNLCLDKYKDDSSVFSVTGYNHPIDMPKVNATTVKLQEMSAWGCGFWKHKMLSRDYKLRLIDDMIADKTLLKHFSRRRPSIFTGLMYMKKKGIIWGDCFNTAYEYYKDKYCVYPIKSLVQNHGWDGSGQHGGVVEEYGCQEVEGKITEPFEIIEANEQETKFIDSAVVKYWKGYEGGIHQIVNKIEITIYCLTGKIYLFDDTKRLYKQLRSKLQKP